MRLAWLASLFGVALGCTPAAAPRDPVEPAARASRLPPPAVLDLDAPDAAYRAAVAVQLQPPWGQFLEDIRLRLPATDPLNVMSLATTADLTIDTAGKVVAVSLSGSGNGDFDRAVRQVITDAAPLPRPPAHLWADDDRVHLRWLFARDRRQAGPVTSTVVEVVLPVAEVTTRLIKAGDLTRAARRIQREPAGPARTDAITHLMTAGLREALASSDGGVQRAAVDAIKTANVGVLASELHDVTVRTNDADLRVAGLLASAALGDHASVSGLVGQLRVDIRSDRRLALAEAQALLDLDAKMSALGVAVEEAVAGPSPNPIALHVLGLAEVGGLDMDNALSSRFSKWQRSADARVRAGLCAAYTRAPVTFAVSALTRGLADRDAKVRAACLDMIADRMAYANEQKPTTYIGAKNITRAAALVRDRDERVRAAAIRALGAVHAEAASLPDLATDSSAEVRAAYLRAIAQRSQLHPLDGGRERVRPLLDDRDAGVRAAAWGAFVVLLRKPIDKIEADPPPADFERLVAQAIKDPAAEVRRAVTDAITDEVALIRIAGGDDDSDVRTWALVRVAIRSGRAASADLLLGRFVAAVQAERVRAALAWHLSH